MPDAPPGYVYDGGWRALAPDDRRTRPYTTCEAASRALARGELEGADEPPIGWYALPRRAQISECKRCKRRLVWVRRGDPPRALPLELAQRVEYGGLGYAPVHPERCQPPARRRDDDDDETTGRHARSFAFEDD